MTKPKKTDKQTIKDLRSELEDMRAELDAASNENKYLKLLLKDKDEALCEWKDAWHKDKAKREALANMLAILRITTKHAENILEEQP